jgi:hypothetical protein
MDAAGSCYTASHFLDITEVHWQVPDTFGGAQDRIQSEMDEYVEERVVIEIGCEA